MAARLQQSPSLLAFMVELRNLVEQLLLRHVDGQMLAGLGMLDTQCDPASADQRAHLSHEASVANSLCMGSGHHLLTTGIALLKKCFCRGLSKSDMQLVWRPAGLPEAHLTMLLPLALLPRGLQRSSEH